MSDVPRLAAAGLPLQFPSAFAAVHAAIPVDQRTHEGRYVWEPRLHSFPAAPGESPIGNGQPRSDHCRLPRSHEVCFTANLYDFVFHVSEELFVMITSLRG
ncbi:hypothetical protein IscW_ISCW005489 [Ixodes scapularis]|uniref:Uncharacterized protein n=1 Tax=Ixodes scapularis TaxID=6945 RepID=B7PPQ0_IXOSC|nr:hypothetical protein IscW_ISCW005489 [Ixodes scapularis]|eukprot:XP_002435742.1 hypothetical protein IscW_ISCW005489 [Ixodes scapularis]